MTKLEITEIINQKLSILYKKYKLSPEHDNDEFQDCWDRLRDSDMPEWKVGHDMGVLAAYNEMCHVLKAVENGEWVNWIEWDI